MKKVAAKKKAPAKKPIAKKRSAKPAVKKPPSKKSPAKKSAAKKAAVKKRPAKKAVAKKAAVKKSPAKKSVKKAVKKSPAKKLAKKPAKKLVKKSPAKRVAAKKTVTKRASPKPVVIARPTRPTYSGPPWPLMDLILAALDDAKAENTVAINLEGRSSMTDGMVVTTGRVARHVAAIADQVLIKLKASGKKDIRIEGQETGDWCLVDAGDVIIHIFRPEVRSFYNLEKLWSPDAPKEQN